MATPAPPPTPPTPPTRAAQHDAITRIATCNGCKASRFHNGVSIHTMHESVSFVNLKAIVAAAAGQEKRTFVGTVDGALVVSVNFNYETPPPAPAGEKKKKRARDPVEEAVEHAVDRVKRGLKENEDVTPQAIQSANNSLYALVSHLRGADGEVAVESWGLSYKKAEGAFASTTRPRLIISVRLTPGVAVSVAAILEHLGPRCTADGMLTIKPSESLNEGFRLPLSEQAQTAEAHGQRAVTLFATVQA